MSYIIRVQQEGAAPESIIVHGDFATAHRIASHELDLIVKTESDGEIPQNMADVVDDTLRRFADQQAPFEINYKKWKIEIGVLPDTLTGRSDDAIKRRHELERDAMGFRHLRDWVEVETDGDPDAPISGGNMVEKVMQLLEGSERTIKPNFTLRITLGNAAMQSREDVAGMLALLATGLRDGTRFVGTHTMLRDINGNTVGHAEAVWPDVDPCEECHGSGVLTNSEPDSDFPSGGPDEPCDVCHGTGQADDA